MIEIDYELSAQITSALRAQRRRRKAGFNPSSLFAVSGARGFLYDFSDYSTQFTDTAGTTQVTGTGQAVALVTDKSGLGNNATQSTLGNRPLTTTIGTGFRGVQFDGTDDWLQTAAIDFRNSDEVTIVAGVQKLSDAAQSIVVELTGSLAGNNGAFALQAPAGAAANFGFVSKGTAAAFATSPASFAAPNTAVLTAQAKISTDSATLRRNGTQVATSATDQGTGNFSNAVVYIGRRGGTSLPINCVLTSLLVINRALTATEIGLVESFANTRTGAY